MLLATNPTTDAALDSVESLALSTLTAILKDPETSITERRLAAAAILRHVASQRRAGHPPGRRRSIADPAAGTIVPSTSPAAEPAPSLPAPAKPPDPFSRIKRDQPSLSAVSRLITLAGGAGSSRSRTPASNDPPLLALDADG